MINVKLGFNLYLYFDLRSFNYEATNGIEIQYFKNRAHPTFGSQNFSVLVFL